MKTQCFPRVCPTRVGMGRRKLRCFETCEPFAPRVWGWADVLVPVLGSVPGLPHACGDGPVVVAAINARPGVCPTRVGMGRCGRA